MNGKYFIPPPRDGSNFKELFKRLATAGAGRPVVDDGFPPGPWTPDLLTEAISQIDTNLSGIDVRTVQLWFQDNEKGIGADNIHWLARIFGCDDPAATSEWQVELSAAQSRLTAKRRNMRKRAGFDAPEALDIERSPSDDDEIKPPAKMAEDNGAQGQVRRLSLAMKSEAIFSRGSPLDLPASVFAGAVALGFISYLTGVHNVTYGRVDGLIKQVGFLWAPNWTLLFMVFMPLFFAFVVELLVFWKDEGRLQLLPKGDQMSGDDGWTRSVEASSYTYWAVFLICLAFAGLFQWIGVRLIPLMDGADNYATDWGSLALVRPEIISVPVAIAFTGLAYLYMCICFYLFFVGLILLYTLAHDLWKIGKASKLRQEIDHQHEVNEVGLRVMGGIFRCTVLGILIAMCMKLQSFYLTSNAESIVAWLLGDLLSVLNGPDEVWDGNNYSMPNHYTSLLIAMAACVVFLYGSIRLGVGSQFQRPLGKMSTAVILIAVSYLLIGALPGFSILLSVGVLVALYGLFDPGFGTRPTHELGDNQDVL
jgi:hypothetical protein